MRVAEETLTQWSDIHRYAKQGWLYRGQRSAAWNLETSLERCCDRQSLAATERNYVERELLREFKRAYHQYAHHLPKEWAILEWLSLMQHHGAPTRILDFSYLIYVAAYFAIEDADTDCAVWAVNGPWALQQSANALRLAGKSDVDALRHGFNEPDEAVFESLFLQAPHVPAACPLNPFRLNERLRIQKGIFLVPGDITGSFMENLEALVGYNDAQNVIKIIIPLALKREVLKQLFQMNISRTSLFPGLDGYARSLGIYHPAFDPMPWHE